VLQEERFRLDSKENFLTAEAAKPPEGIPGGT